MWETLLSGLIIGALFVIYNIISSALTRREAIRDDPVRIKKRDENLDELIRFIHGALTFMEIKVEGNYSMPEHIESEINSTNFAQSSIQALANDILKFLNVPENVTIEIHKDYGGYDYNLRGYNFVMYDSKRTGQIGDGTRPGYYYSYGTGGKVIHIFEKHNYSLKHVLAILVHELTHHFLFYHCITIEPEEKNEKLTDVTAIYLGFGEILREGYKPIKWIANSIEDADGSSFKVNSHKIGYLSVNDVAYVIKQIRKLRKSEDHRQRKEEFEKNQTEARQQMADELMEILALTEMLYCNNVEALDILSERDVVIGQDDTKVIMESSKAYYSGSMNNYILRLKNKIQTQTSGSSYKAYKAEINRLSTKIAYWNSVIGKYL